MIKRNYTYIYNIKCDYVKVKVLVGPLSAIQPFGHPLTNVK